MIYEYIFLAFIIALFKKGSITKFLETNLTHQPIILLSVFIQIGTMMLYNRVTFIEQTFSFWIIGSYLILIYAVWKNFHLPGFKIFFTGLILNFLAIVTNGGRMPVSIEAIETIGLGDRIQELGEGYRKHQFLTENTNLSFLTDVIPIVQPFVYWQMVASVGDLLVTAGLCWFIYKRVTKDPIQNHS
ncbi:DUF5317 domain-containing protein [Salirhabdus salicampi]|uniref:DUF5317 domain-containing protein n=1 Tax=Salirhabdus salicampi TaxID=476102 RepID=UPI0020C380DC|nr:DUF5317 domain-containing protein [Salirhabdus salicampi]MCP8615727.1 DUF5317 domain-containing protein [Salirhabdus salicampi]